MNYRLFCSIALFGLIGLSMPAFSEPDSVVQTQLAELEASSGGRLGVSAVDTSNNQHIQYRANEFFPMGCTSKVMGVAAILKASTTDNQLLKEVITYKKEDLVTWSPITEKHLTNGMTVAALCAAAISYSDNTAMNLLTKKLGGLAALNTFARSINDNYFQLDHGWPEVALANPASKEDATTPAAMEESLRKLTVGDVLATSQREMLITWLKNNVTGKARIKAGVPKNWVVGHKTGTGIYYGTTNDIAILWPPHCSPLIMALYYSSNDKNAPKREDVIAKAAHLIMEAYAQSDTCIANLFKIKQ